MKKNSPQEIKRLIQQAGGNAAVTAFLGYKSRNTVFNWPSRGIPPHARRLLQDKVKAAQ